MERPFPWQELPVELQDWILDQVTGDEFDYASPDYEASLRVKDYPLWNVLAVSRGMKAQYEKRMANRTTLIFSDHENFNFTLLPLPVRVADVKQIQIRAFIVCDTVCSRNVSDCQAPNDLSQTVSLINKILAQLPDVDSLEISLGLWWKPESSETFQWPNTPHDPHLSDKILTLVNTPKLQSLAVYRVEERCLDASSIVNESRRLVSWTKASEAWDIAAATEPQGAVEKVEKVETASRDAEIGTEIVDLGGDV